MGGCCHIKHYCICPFIFVLYVPFTTQSSFRLHLLLAHSHVLHNPDYRE